VPREAQHYDYSPSNDAPTRQKSTSEPQETPKHHSHSTAREVVPPFKYAKKMENGRGSPIVPARQSFTVLAVEDYVTEAHGTKKNIARTRSNTPNSIEHIARTRSSSLSDASLRQK